MSNTIRHPESSPSRHWPEFPTKRWRPQWAHDLGILKQGIRDIEFEVGKTHGVGGLGTGDIVLIRLRLSCMEQTIKFVFEGFAGINNVLELAYDSGGSRGGFGDSICASIGGCESVSFSHEAPELGIMLANGSLK